VLASRSWIVVDNKRCQEKGVFQRCGICLTVFGNVKSATCFYHRRKQNRCIAAKFEYERTRQQCITFRGPFPRDGLTFAVCGDLAVGGRLEKRRAGRMPPTDAPSLSIPFEQKISRRARLMAEKRRHCHKLLARSGELHCGRRPTHRPQIM
jgi:hypothetical protein